MLRLTVHPKNPQARHLDRAAALIRTGALVIYPTDTTYGLGCDIFAKRSVERIYQLKGISPKQPLSFVCADLAQIAQYAEVHNAAYRILRNHTPGKYTFVLPATRAAPRQLQSQARRVGVRIADDPVCLALTRQLGHPIISTTVTQGGQGPHSVLAPVNDPELIAAQFAHSVDVLLDAGVLLGHPSSVVDLTQSTPRILREGSGDVQLLQAPQ